MILPGIAAAGTPTPYVFGANPIRVSTSIVDGRYVYTSQSNKSPNMTVDKSVGTLSMWVLVGATGADRTAVFGGTAGGVLTGIWAFHNNSTSKWTVRLRNAVATKAFTITSSASHSYGGEGWVHIMASWDTNAGVGAKTGQLWIDGVDTSPTFTDTNTAFDVGYTASGTYFIIGADTTNGFVDHFTLGYAQFYLNTDTKMDLSVSGNRSKFRSAGGHPVDLGEHGILPTGAYPSFLLTNKAGRFGVNMAALNAGMSGAFPSLLSNGTPTDAATSP